MKIKSIIYGFISIISGILLFFILRTIEQLLSKGFLVNAFLEEIGKLSIFIFFYLFFYFTGQQKNNNIIFFPFFVICFFAITENIIYLIKFPDTSIFFRLIYSYPIHLNTALVYFLLVENKKWIFIPFLLLCTTVYHFFLNILNFIITSRLIFSCIAGINIIIFITLFLLVENRIIIRSELNDKR